MVVDEGVDEGEAEDEAEAEGGEEANDASEVVEGMVVVEVGLLEEVGVLILTEGEAEVVVETVTVPVEAETEMEVEADISRTFKRKVIKSCLYIVYIIFMIKVSSTYFFMYARVFYYHLSILSLLWTLLNKISFKDLIRNVGTLHVSLKSRTC